MACSVVRLRHFGLQFGLDEGDALCHAPELAFPSPQLICCVGVWLLVRDKPRSLVAAHLQPSFEENMLCEP